ncbi:hypothetical protein [Zavarzinia sp.]|uniref:hypothetical protein n=1 Tax=Zavarzinia sp. TaxID=2027920 RepID=UPI003BB582A8|nr:hypothetical protein [Zavarzinia sp.]
MGKLAAIILVICSSFGLQGCESNSLFGGDPPAWPGADKVAYDTMQSNTSCRTTLAAPDCHVAQFPQAGGPKALGPAIQ